jgi:hypothetical protein
MLDGIFGGGGGGGASGRIGGAFAQEGISALAGGGDFSFADVLGGLVGGGGGGGGGDAAAGALGAGGSFMPIVGAILNTGSAISEATQADENGGDEAQEWAGAVGAVLGGVLGGIFTGGAGAGLGSNLGEGLVEGIWDMFDGEG